MVRRSLPLVVAVAAVRWRPRSCDAFVLPSASPRRVSATPPATARRVARTATAPADPEATPSPPGGRRHAVVATSPELGGDIVRIGLGPDDDASFLQSQAVPTFAVLPPINEGDDGAAASALTEGASPRRMGLGGVLGTRNAFVVEDALSASACEDVIGLCDGLGFGRFDAGKNRHGAMQIVVSKGAAEAVLRAVGPHVDVGAVAESERSLAGERVGEEGSTYALSGINRRFRVYRYAPGGLERFSPHIDAGFPPGGSSLDDDGGGHGGDGGTPYLHFDAGHQYAGDVTSRLTVLLYLNGDFRGGHTRFYEPERERDFSVDGGDECGQVIASVRPRAGSALVFPQGVGEDAVSRARRVWPLHEGSPVTSGRAKYVIRTDVLFERVPDEAYGSPEEARLFEHDGAVRDAFLQRSSVFSSRFLSATAGLYNPHMGVENAGPLLYSLARFVKARRVVEVGAGYTTPFLLQALKDNEEEMGRIVDLEREGRLRMLDYPFGTPNVEEWGDATESGRRSSLLCIDNCEHQKETASGAVHVARILSLDGHVEFLRGDAFDALSTHFADSDDGTVDLLWADFGLGDRVADYVSRVWRYVRPGGMLVVHSTLTNRRTREWTEAVRRGDGEGATGLPPGSYADVSLLEPHKRYQNSMTVVQKRVGGDGRPYREPLYSEYA